MGHLARPGSGTTRIEVFPIIRLEHPETRFPENEELVCIRPGLSQIPIVVQAARGRMH
jgi:hypothetical protein